MAVTYIFQGKIVEQVKCENAQWRMCKEGEVLYSGDIRGSIRSADLRSLNSCHFEKKVGKEAICSLEVFEGNKLAVGVGNKIQIWDTRSISEPLRVFNGYFSLYFKY